MKAVYWLLLVLLLATSAYAQTSTSPTTTDPANVEVTQFRWRREVFIPALYDDPMRINQDHADLVRDQKETSKENVNRAKQGQTPIPQPQKKIASNVPVGSTPMGIPLGDEPAGNQNLPAQATPGPSSIHYVYQASMKNTGTKTIRAVVWQYILFDRATEAEVGRHQFADVAKIRPGKSANLVGRSKTPPSRLLIAENSSHDASPKLGERVEIERIEYDDGSVWQRPAQ